MLSWLGFTALTAILLAVHRRSRGVERCGPGSGSGADAGKYWETLDRLYRSQSLWTQHHQVRLDQVWQLLATVGLDLERSRADMNDPRITAIIEQDLADAETLGVRLTPGFFVNGKPLEPFGLEPLAAELSKNYPRLKVSIMPPTLSEDSAREEDEMRGRTTAALTALCLMIAAGALAMDLVRVETRTDEAVAAFGVSGEGVVIAILDRGIDWSHPDFINPDGTTRIQWMLDMSGFNLCDPGNPPPVEYSEEEINAALSGGPALPFRDAVGHGTATAGVAAGNGRGLPDGRYRGIAPEADLVIVKLTSEGAPAHDGEPAEAPFQGCIDEALDWLDGKLDALGQPAVAIINSGTQWGPIDGTSAVSRKIDEVFGSGTPGRVMVIPSGDEGSLPNHAGADYDETTATVIGISKASAAFAVMSAWYSGSQPAAVTVSFDDGTTVGPVLPGSSASQSGITIFNYLPGTEFYPWTSTSGDGAVWVGVDGHATTGSFQIQGLASGTGHVDLYGDVTGPNLTPILSMTDHLVPGRLTDYASTSSAIVVADHVIRNQWIDIDGIPREILDEGDPGELWLKSSGGPTRDGTVHGVDVSAPGQNLFASVGPDSYWATFRFNLPFESDELYTRFGGTSGSAPIVVGATALLLELNPELTTEDVRQILRDTAVEDANTGGLPNADWGFGKLDVFEATRRAVLFTDGFESGDTSAWSQTVP